MGKRIQDAHEAIRPTDISRLPAQVKESLSRDQFRLYQLIWKRFAASRMQQAKYETTSVKVQGGEYYFTASASKLKFDGFMAVYTQDDEEKQENQLLSKNLEMTETQAKDMHRWMQYYCYTQGVMLATDYRDLSLEEMGKELTELFSIMLRHYKAVKSEEELQFWLEKARNLII